MTAVTDGWDATHANLPTVPDRQGAGYTTGTPDIRWTKADWRDHASAVRICQDAGATDTTADVLDVERGAATIAEVAAWSKAALANWHAGTRPGQRTPAVYLSASRVSALRSSLTGAGITSGPRLWIAQWGVGYDFAASQLHTTGTDFPIIGYQYEHLATFDRDVWATGWLEQVSSAPAASGTPPAPAFTEAIMRDLPELKRGAKGKAVRTAQGLLVARYYHLGATGDDHDGIDGDFGPLTESAVRDAQGKAGLKTDGIIGPETWPVLAGV